MKENGKEKSVVISSRSSIQRNEVLYAFAALLMALAAFTGSHFYRDFQEIKSEVVKLQVQVTRLESKIELIYKSVKLLDLDEIGDFQNENQLKSHPAFSWLGRFDP